MTRKNIAKGLYISVIGAYFDFFAWGLLKESKERKDNSFLGACDMALSRTFPLQVANLFEDTKGVVSIKKYQKELKRGGTEKDKAVYKKVQKLLQDNDDKIKRLINRRGIDLAHSNLENFIEAWNKVPTNKRKGKAKDSIVTGKEIIELLVLGKEIYRIIEKHEFNKLMPITSTLDRIQTDYKKILT